MKAVPETTIPSVGMFGVYPPPYGGISIHLKRLLPYLEEARIKYVLYNTGPTRIDVPNVVNVGRSPLKLCRVLFKRQHKIIHFHTEILWVRLLAIFASKLYGYKIIFTGHGERTVNNLFNKNIAFRVILKWIIKQARLFIATNSYIKDNLINFGIPEFKVVNVPAFIPPSHSSADVIPPEVADFVNAHTPILMAIGKFALMYGKDAYGMNLMLDLMSNLREDFPKIGLVVFFGGAISETANPIFENSVGRAKSPPLSEHILYYQGKGEFYPALKICDVFLRPTTTDGDANSIREALWTGTPVVASDAVPRPDGCVLFHTEFIDGFRNAVLEVLKNIDKYKESIKKCELGNPALDIVNIYNDILKEK
jgi:glycosyltransferase involved in cell wall biosynthesis